eukprot:CAMPEP_0174871412 /NCGR_PEP_ID=MMETSP1114-20130205/71459_1 /TAXON_ID=312471 /ORGANISM="Neobodo designis, Strain CCAP 1951/1" /LENGTH=684 /DNA_ID=CAMNT_0016106693 /DNA_START=15 /DNA_END=2066 /DNA_ORIENTATION=+
MMGSEEGEADEGLIPRICRGLCGRGAVADCGGDSFNSPWSKPSVRATYYEIYNERVRDLIPADDSTLPELKIRHIPGQGPTVVGLNEVDVDSWEHCAILIEQGLSRRSVASTKMNDRSSRSHSVLTMFVDVRRTIGTESVRRRSRMNLVDLAGSERVKKSGAEGVRLREASAINLSLTTLKNVIDALVERRSTVPYRESKMTWLLSESLGGNSKTTMVVCVSPHEDNLDETQNSLRYGSKAQAIACSPQVNVDSDKRRLSALQDEVEEMQRAIRTTHRDALDRLHVALAFAVRRVAEVDGQARQAKIEAIRVERSLQLEEQRCIDGGRAAAFAKAFTSRCLYTFEREIDALRFHLELEAKHLEFEAASLSKSRAHSRHARRDLDQWKNNHARRETEQTALKLRNDSIAGTIVKLRAEHARLRGRIERTQSTRHAARFVAVGVELLERRRAGALLSKAAACHSLHADEVVHEVLRAAEHRCDHATWNTLQLRRQRESLQEQLVSARAHLAVVRKRWSSLYSTALEKLVFEEREGRVADEEAARDLARIDADGAIAVERITERQVSWLGSAAAAGVERLAAHRAEQELRSAVFDSEKQDELADVRRRGQGLLQTTVSQATMSRDNQVAAFALKYSLLDDDASEMKSIAERSRAAAYRQLARRIIGSPPKSEDATSLLRDIVPSKLR